MSDGWGSDEVTTAEVVDPEADSVLDVSSTEVLVVDGDLPQDARAIANNGATTTQAATAAMGRVRRAMGGACLSRDGL